MALTRCPKNEIEDKTVMNLVRNLLSLNCNQNIRIGLCQRYGIFSSAFGFPILFDSIWQRKTIDVILTNKFLQYPAHRHPGGSTINVFYSFFKQFSKQNC